MATVKLCKAAKDYPEIGVKKGESYYWWKFRYGGKQRSKTPPKPQQLTQSGFVQSVCDIEDKIAALQPMDQHEDLKSEVEAIIEDVTTLRDEQEEKKSNMPDSLQESATGELLQERYDALDNAVSELEAIDLDDEDQQSIIDAVNAVSLDA